MHDIFEQQLSKNIWFLPHTGSCTSFSWFPTWGVLMKLSVQGETAVNHLPWPCGESGEKPLL